MTKYHIMLLAPVLLTPVSFVFFKIISVDFHGEIMKVIVDPRLCLAVAVYGTAFAMWIVAASRIDYTVLVFSNTMGYGASKNSDHVLRCKMTSERGAENGQETTTA